MSKYWCKCGRVVNKSTNAATTGNRDTANCAGCPHLLPYGPTAWDKAKNGFVQDVQGYECRMTDHPLDYTTHISSLGGPNDKTVLHVESLDFDFLDTITEWVHDTFTQGELDGGFRRNTLRGPDYMDGYRVTFYPSQNKKGIAAKQQLFQRFFHPDGTRLDMTPEEEKAKVLADIEKGKAAAQNKEIHMEDKVYKDAKGILYRVGETGELGNADRCRLTIQQLGITPGAQWRKKSMAPNWSMAARKDALQALEIMAEENDWKQATEAEIQYNLTERAALLDDDLDGTSLYTLDLSERTVRCLEHAGIDTVEELAAMSDEEIMRIRDMGRKGYEEIRAALGREETGDAGKQVTTLKDLGLSDNCIRYLYDMGFDNEDVDILDSLLPEEEERLRREFPDNWEKIQAYLQSGCTDTNDGTSEESLEAENPTPMDDLPWSAAATAAADEPAESPTPAALTPTTETAAAISEQTESAATVVPASSNTPTAFDYSGLDEQTVVDLHLAEHEYTSGKKMAEVGFRRMVEGVAIAHDALCGPVVHQVDNYKHGNRGEDSFRAWCASIGIGKTTAYKMLQVADAFMASSPNQQKVLEQLPSTLLYDFAKPSTTEEEKKAILSGDITTHKQYQEVVARNKQLEKEAELDRKERDEAYAKADKYRAEADRRAQDQQRLEGLVQTEKSKADLAARKSAEAWEQVDAERKARKQAEEKLANADAEQEKMERLADDANDRADAAEAKVKELESRPIEVTGANAADIARWREEGAAQARQEQVNIIADLQDQVEDAKNAQENVVDALYRMAEQIAASCAAQLENWSKAAACLEPDAYMDCVQQFDPLRIQILHLMMEGADDDEMS